MDGSSNLLNFETGKSIMSFLGSSSSPATMINNNGKAQQKSNKETPTRSTDAYDIPKDELMALCMKLNKKMQSLESKCHDLNRHATLLNGDRSYLLELISNLLETNIPTQTDEPLARQAIQSRINDWKNSNIENLSLLEKKIVELETEIHTKKRENLKSNGESVNAFEIKSSSDIDLDEISQENENLRKELSERALYMRKIEKEISKLDASNKLLKEQFVLYETEIKEKSQKMTSLEKDNEDRRVKHEENVMYLSMQLNTYKSACENLESEMSALRLFKQVQESNKTLVEDDVESSSREKFLDLQRDFKDAMKAKAELENSLLLLKKDLNKMTQLKDDYLSRFQDQQVEISRLSEQGEVNQKLQQQIAAFKTKLEDDSSLINRLKQESLSNERNHAMKIAMLATAEVQLDQLRKELVLKEQTAKEAVERVELLNIRLINSEARLNERIKEAADKMNELNNNEEILKITYEQQLNLQKEKYELQVESIQRENSKKSSTARLMLSKKEEEIRVLQAKVNELQSEIASGGPQEKKIFEIATNQARRDHAHGTHNDNRELAFQQLLSALESKDLELAKFQHIQSQLSNEVIELRRTTRREGVNMDYLKNVILQYMTFPVNCTERQQLVPVISTLLQFNENELSEVIKSSKEPVWTSNRPIVEIKRSLRMAAGNLVDS